MTHTIYLLLMTAISQNFVFVVYGGGVLEACPIFMFASLMPQYIQTCGAGVATLATVWYMLLLLERTTRDSSTRYFFKFNVMIFVISQFPLKKRLSKFWERGNASTLTKTVLFQVH